MIFLIFGFTVSVFGFGIKPFGPKIFAICANFDIMVGVATAISKLALSEDLISLIKSIRVNKEGENTTLALPFWAETVETPPVPTIILNDIPYSVNELESINGTASSGYFSLNKVLVSIKNTTDNTYWNGSSWASTETWLEASGIESWSYSMPELTPGESYEVKAKAIDKIGNESVVMDSFKIEKSESYIWLVWPILGGVIIIGGITIYLELKKGKRSQP